MIPKWLEVALTELGDGVKEVPGPGDNPRIVSYLQTAHQAPEDEIPWCAAFVGWCILQAGFIPTGRANARSYLDWGLPSAPLLGAVTVLWRSNPSSAQGHVGFLLDVSDSSVYLLGGNQSDRVSVTAYPKDRVLGYRWSNT